MSSAKVFIRTRGLTLFGASAPKRKELGLTLRPMSAIVAASGGWARRRWRSLLAIPSSRSGPLGLWTVRGRPCVRKTWERINCVIGRTGPISRNAFKNNSGAMPDIARASATAWRSVPFSRLLVPFCLSTGGCSRCEAHRFAGCPQGISLSSYRRFRMPRCTAICDGYALTLAGLRI